MSKARAAVTDELDTGRVSRAAALLQVSEFELFHRAHVSWYGHSGASDVLNAAFQRYLNYADVPLWVRDFARKTLRADSKPKPAAVTAKPAAAAQLFSIMLGLFILLALTAVVAGIIYLAVLTEQSSPLRCTLPPCY